MINVSLTTIRIIICDVIIFIILTNIDIVIIIITKCKCFLVNN